MPLGELKPFSTLQTTSRRVNNRVCPLQDQLPPKLWNVSYSFFERLHVSSPFFARVHLCFDLRVEFSQKFSKLEISNVLCKILQAFLLFHPVCVL